MVTDAFYGPRPEGLLTRHLDGNKLNNCIYNLAYGTAQENHEDSVLHGVCRVGEFTYSTRKLTMDQANEIRSVRASGLPIKRIAARFGVHKATVQSILKNETYKQVVP